MSITEKISPVFRAFSSRNYRLFFAGQGISLVGTWMSQTAVIWLVYSLTNSALLLGVVGFAQQVPNFLLSPFAGVLVDRLNRHRILIGTQILSMIQSLALAALAFSGTIQIWHIIVLSIFQGCVNAIDMPTRQTFVIELVEQRENLSNAIALNSSLFSGARLIGPAIAGLVIAAVGTSTCFLIDGVSYIAVIIGLLAMRIRPRQIASVGKSDTVLRKLKEGLVYAFGFPPIRSILLLIGLVSLVGMPYTVLAPIFVTNILHGGPQTLGFLMASSGLGALVSAVYLSSRSTIVGLGKIIAIAPTVFGIALIVFALSKVLWLSLIAMFMLGSSLILQSTSSNTILQTIVEEDKRGRVLSLYTIAFISMATFGNLFAGSLASRIGAPNTLVISGVICIAASIYFSRQLPAMRQIVLPIYDRMGLLTERHL
ncbi:MFS transporter [Phormidesmis priestleyi ULC007]|uniref:MFS transporter n=1 Tax=Phormidesmis priestleyi ULC007 TaxID=1920490 RepID=A0A2T1DKA6_9CYAN|nr:MFS transporter [Phormidesmis priestleyi]PSB20929.1 MFS transporter [Phormidesmis priestleyi ULC007]PZO51884.1 MAG: MFS transporter [Phormidesmis priestleyi]